MDPEKRGYKLQDFVAHDAEVRSLAIGKKSSRVFITGGSDRKVNLWAIGKQTPLLSLSGHAASVEAVQFDSAEVLVLAGSSNGSIKLWDLEEAKVVRSLTGHRSSCTGVEFHPFGEFFASGSSDTDLKIWDIKKKGCLHTYKGHRGAIKTIRFTPDGRWVVTGGEDNIVKVWDLTAGKLLHDFKFHSGQIHCIDFHPQEFLLATGSADRTVKFWDLETFELIGSAGPAGPEDTGVHSMVFHPDGKTIFCGLDQSLKVFSWEPVRCHDVVDMGWTNMADLSIYEGKLLGCSYHERRVGLWATDISLIGPYALGVLPKANFFAEFVHSIDDLPAKPTDSAANFNPPLATSHPKSSLKVKDVGIVESKVRGSRLTPSSTDKIKKDRSSNIARRPDSSVKSSIQSVTPMRRMKPADSPSTNPRTVERNSGQRDILLTSRSGTANNSLTARKGHFTESAPVKDIYTTSQAISSPVVVPRDILEDKTVGSFCKGTTAVVDDFRAPADTRKYSLGVDAADSDTPVRPMLAKSDMCSEGLSGLKFSFGLTPYNKKEEYNNVDKGHITQMAEHMDRAMSLEHPVPSNDDKSFEPCSTTETARVKYVRGVAVPLGKTKSLVERFEKREASSIDCSPQTSSCGDRAVQPDGPSSHSAEQNPTYEKDLSTVDHVMTPINLIQNHDEFINNLKLRLTKLEMMRHVFEQSGIKGAIAAVIKLPDSAVQADVISALKGKLDLFNLEIFSSVLPVLAALLSSNTERHATVSLEILLDLIKIFGPVIQSTLSANSAVGVDLQAEQRLQRCTRCFNHLQKIQQVLHPLIMRGGEQAQLAQELSLSLQDLVVI